VAPEPAKDVEAEKDPIESSILAAIAEAVDVLVIEDGNGKEPAPVAAPAAPQKAVAPTPPADDADIGDEIQRILAAYSQNRKPSGK